MPSTSAKQHRFMQAVAHSPSFAKKAGVSQSVGKDFSAADKGRTFSKGGMMKIRKFANEGYVDGEDGNQYRDYDPDKTYSGRSFDDDTGALAENTPTRSTAKAAPAAPSRAASTARAAPAAPSRAAPAAPKAAPKTTSEADSEDDFSDVYSSSTSTTRAAPTYRYRPITNDAEAAKARAAGVSSSTPPTVFSQEAKAERAEKLQADQAEFERDAGKSSKAKKPEPLSNGAMAAIGAGATAAGAAGAAGVAKLAGKKAGFIGKVIEKFNSKGSKTPPADALAKIKVPSEAEKLAELASSAAKNKAAGAATPSRSSAQTDRIQIPERRLSTSIADRAAEVAGRPPTGGGRIQTPARTLPNTIAERAKTIAGRPPTGGGRIQTPTRNLPNTLAERAKTIAENSKARGGRIVRMASGGSVSAASSRADGIAQRGKTKFRIY